MGQTLSEPVVEKVSLRSVRPSPFRPICPRVCHCPAPPRTRDLYYAAHYRPDSHTRLFTAIAPSRCVMPSSPVHHANVLNSVSSPVPA